MGRNVTKNKKPQKQTEQRKYLRAGALAALLAVGAASLLGMAVFNGNAKPNRDMKWYVRDGAVQVAAPPMGEGYVSTGYAMADGARKAEDTEEPTATPGSTATPDPTDTPSPTAEAGPVTLTITAVGDCTLGGQVGAAGQRNFVQCVENYGYDYFFSGVRDIFEADDLTIVNLEGPLTSSNRKEKENGFIFKGDPEYVNILSGSSVELCNVANNHTLDYGKEGLAETARVLEASGIGYSGFSRAYYTQIKGVRVGSLGFTQWEHSKGDIAKAVAEARLNCDLLIVSIHWGVEGQHETSATQRALGRAAVDAGADLVIGTHPHVYQGIEKYKDKYIVYSLGNFCFGGNANPADKRCLIFQQSFSFTPGVGIVRAGIMDEGINIIPATVSSVKDRNDFQPTIMTAQAGAQLLKNVASYSKNFALADTRWMADNYMLRSGLITAEGDGEGSVNTSGAEATEDDIGAV